MDTENTVILAIWLVLLLVFLVGVFIINEKHKELVKKLSGKFSKVNKLNDLYQFYELSPVVELHRACKSKKDFDRVNLRDFLINCILENNEQYRGLIKKSKDNQENFQKYCGDFDSIMKETTEEDTTNYNKYSFFQKIEEQLCLKNKKCPITSFGVRISKSYVSPKGRNFYQSSQTFSFDNVIACCGEAEKAIERRKTTQYQRGLMTDSLRYDVMKRDGFKCVLCGATAGDGIKLHVDHIFPVSKGGKTELNNLRTLCDRCNLGKKAKYDFNGPN